MPSASLSRNRRRNRSQHALTEQVARVLHAHRLASPGERIVVAVSGGLDSVSLLAALVALRPAWRFTLRVAHLNHQLRPEAAEDAAFVEQLAARYGLPVTVGSRPVAAMAQEQGRSLEDMAREERYAFLREVARQYSAARIAVAHTMDDQVETVLLHLVRGAGADGLSGMPLCRPLERDCRLIRPLLACWRRDVAAFAQAQGLAWREDASNRDPAFLRNRIRHELLPLLERYNPQARSAIATLAETARAEHELMTTLAGRRLRQTRRPYRPGAVRLGLRGLRRQPLALRRAILRLAIERVKGDLRLIGFQHWQELDGLLTERPDGSIVDLPGRLQAVKSGSDLLIRDMLNLEKDV